MTTYHTYAEAMARRTYAELLDIVGKLRNDYQPDAVVAAEAELKKRDLSPPKNEPAEKEIKTKKPSAAEKANEPLQAHWKVLTLLLPGLLNLIRADELKAEGYDRQYKEIWRWFFYGLGFYAVLFILILALALLSS